MERTEFLLNRLDRIGESFSRRDTALALIGLGSVGRTQGNLDRFSDLDFFVIVATGSKTDYLEDLSWLTDVAPVGFCFANTRNGYKMLTRDGVFYEFAVFVPDELDQIPYSPGRVVWKAPDVSDGIALPRKRQPPAAFHSLEWLLGEALTNLYVGLMREHRGETLSAMRFIQGYAVDRVLELARRLDPSAYPDPDLFDLTRRVERRCPELAPLLPEMLPGYGQNREAARTILMYLQENFEPDPFMTQAIWKELGPCSWSKTSSATRK